MAEINKRMGKGPTSQLLMRRLSNPGSICMPVSPMSPSPAGSGELSSILQRLEMMEIESRDLLQRLFSMVQTDARLQSYIRKRLQDPKVSRIWELVEHILATHQGKLHIDDDDSINGVGHFQSKGVKGRDDGVRMDRFKVRHFDMGDQVVVAQPYVQTAKK